MVVVGVLDVLEVDAFPDRGGNCSDESGGDGGGDGGLGCKMIFVDFLFVPKYTNIPESFWVLSFHLYMTTDYQDEHTWLQLQWRNWVLTPMKEDLSSL